MAPGAIGWIGLHRDRRRQLQPPTCCGDQSGTGQGCRDEPSGRDYRSLRCVAARQAEKPRAARQLAITLCRTPTRSRAPVQALAGLNAGHGRCQAGLPGVGGAVAAFISYAIAKRTSKHSELFGKGNVEGIIAAEVANDAKEGGSLLPTVAFGIPGSPDMAIVLGAFILHGLEPGPQLLTYNLEVVLTLAIGFTICQAIGSVFVLFSSGFISKLVTIRTRYLAPFIIILFVMGAPARQMGRIRLTCPGKLFGVHSLT